MSEESLRELVERVATFHITDRDMLRAQRTMTATLAAGVPSAAAERAYVDAVATYFAGFERDAHAQLKGVDRQLDALYQRQYNLAAERGVAQKRIEAVQGVRAMLAQLAKT